MAGCLGPLASDDAEASAYDAVHEDSNVVFQADAIGLLEDDVTADVVDGIAEEQGLYMEDEDYETLLEDAFDEINEEMSEELEEADIEVQDLEDMVVFMETGEDFEDLETGEERVGVVLEMDVEEDEIDALMDEISEEEDLEESEYGGYTVYTDEAEFGPDAYLSHVGEGMILFAEDESVIEKSIDTWNGDENSIDTDVLPDPDEAHVSVAAYGTEGVVEDVQDEVEQILEAEEEQLEEEFTEEEIEQMEEVVDMPAPESVSAYYGTDGDEELYLNMNLEFATEDAAGEAERLFDEEEYEGVEIDVGLDTTVVTVELATTSDVVVDEVNQFIEDFQESFQQPPEDPIELPTASASFDYDGDTVDVTIDELDEDAYVTVVGLSSDWQDERTVTPADGVEADWADADAAGQTVTVEDVESGDNVEVIVHTDEDDFGTVVDFYVVP